MVKKYVPLIPVLDNTISHYLFILNIQEIAPGQLG